MSKYNLRPRSNKNDNSSTLGLEIVPKPIKSKTPKVKSNVKSIEKVGDINENLIKKLIEKKIGDDYLKLDDYLKFQENFINNVSKRLQDDFSKIIDEQFEDIGELVDKKFEEFEDQIHDSIHEHFDKFEDLIDNDVFEDMVVDIVEEKYRDFFNAIRKTRIHFNALHPKEIKKPVKFTSKFGPPKRNYEDAFDEDKDKNTTINKKGKSTTPNSSNQPVIVIASGVNPNEISTSPQGKSPSKLPAKYDEDILEEFREKDPLLEKLLDLESSLEVKERIYDKYLLYKRSVNGREKDNDKKWLQKVLKLPFNKNAEYPVTRESPKSEIRNLVNKMFNNLNEEVHGLFSVKEEIIVEITKRLLNPENKGSIIVLEGEPGIGKTYMAHNLAKIIGLPFESISLGGCKDADILNGNDPVYVGSHEGSIARALQKMGVSNGLLYLDEIDKLGDTPKGNEVSYALLSILDETQNYKFNDNYFCDIDIDLSRLLVIGSVNDRDKINPILKDRMKFIRLPNPTFEDKVEITKNHFIPKYSKLYDISEEEMVIPMDTIKDIVRKSGNSIGVRDLKRDVDHIISRFNFLKNTYCANNNANTKTNNRKSKKSNNETEAPKLSFTIQDFTLPYTLTPESIDILKGEFKQKEVPESVRKMYM